MTGLSDQVIFSDTAFAVLEHVLLTASTPCSSAAWPFSTSESPLAGEDPFFFVEAELPDDDFLAGVAFLAGDFFVFLAGAFLAGDFFLEAFFFTTPALFTLSVSAFFGLAVAVVVPVLRFLAVLAWAGAAFLAGDLAASSLRRGLRLFSTVGAMLDDQKGSAEWYLLHRLAPR